MNIHLNIPSFIATVLIGLLVIISASPIIEETINSVESDNIKLNENILSGISIIYNSLIGITIIILVTYIIRILILNTGEPYRNEQCYVLNNNNNINIFTITDNDTHPTTDSNITTSIEFSIKLDE